MAVGNNEEDIASKPIQVLDTQADFQSHWLLRILASDDDVIKDAHANSPNDTEVNSANEYRPSPLS